jgi:NAD(P)-dependent dehydrogenase (short-subunit alcohol dehydrogenase family)
MTKKIALITGGSRGLGQNAALHLAKAGVDVVITYRQARVQADDVVSQVEALGGKAAALQLDTTQTTSFADFADQLRQTLNDAWQRQDFDFLVNNAGTGVHRSFEETTEADFDAMFFVHLKGVFFLTQTLLPMLAQNGRILNVSSGLARFSIPGYSAYAVMKGGIEVLTRYLAKELGPRGIAVNTLAPGAIETDFGGGFVRDNEGLNKMIAGMTAMGRVGQPDDIGAAVASLLTSHSQWITAQRIEVSGGQSI